MGTYPVHITITEKLRLKIGNSICFVGNSLEIEGHVFCLPHWYWVYAFLERTHITVLVYCLFFGCWHDPQNHLLLAHDTTQSCQQFQQYKTHEYFVPYRKRGSLTFLRRTEIWSAAKETLGTKGLYVELWMTAPLQGWPQRTRVGETGQRPDCLWFCRLNTMFNYVLLCGSEGLQNHLI